MLCRTMSTNRASDQCSGEAPDSAELCNLDDCPGGRVHIDAFHANRNYE